MPLTWGPDSPLPGKLAFREGHNAVGEPSALHLTRSSDLLQLELPHPDLSIYHKP
jgi:hypothetical protein